MILPPEAHPLVQALALQFTGPTYQRFSTLLVGAVSTTGRRTVANLLRTLRHLAPGHPTDYRRVLSRAPWSGAALGRALTRVRLDRVIPDGPVSLVGDDTADGHPGRAVYGKARHRDPVRSTHSHTAWRYGHTWVVLAVLVTFPFATRRWARPGGSATGRGRHRPPETPRARAGTAAHHARPSDLSVGIEVVVGLTRPSSVEPDAIGTELSLLIGLHLPVLLRADYLRLLAGEQVPKPRRERVQQAVLDIPQNPGRPEPRPLAVVHHEHGRDDDFDPDDDDE